MDPCPLLHNVDLSRLVNVATVPPGLRSVEGQSSRATFSTSPTSTSQSAIATKPGSIADKIALTMCTTWRPSDPEPRRLSAVKTMLDADMLVSLNTDDPSEFASRHMTHMVAAVQRVGGYSDADMVAFARNAFVSSWADRGDVDGWLADLDAYADSASSSQS